MRYDIGATLTKNRPNLVLILIWELSWVLNLQTKTEVNFRNQWEVSPSWEHKRKPEYLAVSAIYEISSPRGSGLQQAYPKTLMYFSYLCNFCHFSFQGLHNVVCRSFCSLSMQTEIERHWIWTVNANTIFLAKQRVNFRGGYLIELLYKIILRFIFMITIHVNYWPLCVTTFALHSVINLNNTDGQRSVC